MGSASCPQSQLLPTTDGFSVPAVLPPRLHMNTAVQCVGSVAGSSGLAAGSSSSADTQFTELLELVCRACLFTALQTHQPRPRIPVALQPHQQLLVSGF